MKTSLIFTRNHLVLAAILYLSASIHVSYAQAVVEYTFDHEGATRAGTTVSDEVPVPPLDFHDYYFSPENIGLSTPQTREFVKYGNHEIDYYNGLLKMEIPLQGYKDKDFELPLSLKYISSGFIPSQRPGMVGQNWVLNFGGVIRRKVNGSPDDVRGNKHDTNFKEYLKDGLLVAIRDRRFRQYTTEELNAFDNIERAEVKGTPYSMYGGVKDVKYDMESDIFTFTFGTHHGSFIIGNDGTPVMLSGDKQYIINIEDLNVQGYSLTDAPLGEPAITIITPDGYTYIFKSKEYAIPSNNYGQKIPVHITAWHLTAITAPNKRTVIFHYENIKSSNQHQLLAYDYSQSSIWRSTSDPNLPPTSRSPIKHTSTKENMIEVINYPRLERVEVCGVDMIKFKYNDMPFFYPNDIETQITPYAVASIEYFPKSIDALKKEEFSYKKDTKGYYFLSSITTSDKGQYKFLYNLPNQSTTNPTLPDPLTISTDHWGFWNGGNTQSGDVEAKDFCNNIENNRQVSSTKAALTGLLCKIIYPTGGHSEIKYEPNYYTGCLNRDYSNLGYYYTSVDKQICGGARVASITDYDDVSGQRRKRTIEYKSPGSNIESGIIGFKPKYHVNASEKYTRSGFDGYWVDKIVMVNGQQTVRREYVTYHYMDIITTSTKTMSSVSFNGNSTFEEYFIGYSDVTERYDDGSYIHYNYSSRKDILDDNQNYNWKVYLPAVLMTSYEGCSLSKLEQAEAHNLYNLNDLSRFRGALQKKTLYSASNVPVSRTSYTYNIAAAKTKYVTCVRSVPRGLAAYKIFLQPCLVTAAEETKHTPSGEIKVHNSYTYNSYNQLAEVQQTNSDGSEHITKYSYVTDISMPDGSERSLLQHNMLNSPLKIIKTKNSKIVDALRFKYGTSNNLSGSPLLQILSRPMPDGEYVIETYHKYDEYGNPVHITTKDNISLILLWSYNGLYPVAEIKNSTYKEVFDALGRSPESLSSHDKPDIYLLNTLQAKLPNAVVTTYEYIPYVGIKTINKSGIADYYEYDSSGRLQVIKDDTGSPVEGYQYHYKVQ